MAHDRGAEELGGVVCDLNLHPGVAAASWYVIDLMICSKLTEHLRDRQAAVESTQNPLEVLPLSTAAAGLKGYPRMKLAALCVQAEKQ